MGSTLNALLAISFSTLLAELDGSTATTNVARDTQREREKRNDKGRTLHKSKGERKHTDHFFFFYLYIFIELTWQQEKHPIFRFLTSQSFRMH